VGRRRWLSAALALVGCSTSPSVATTDAGDAAPSIDQAIQAALADYEAKYCDAVARCDPVLFAQVYATLDGCAARNAEARLIVPVQHTSLPWRGWGFGYGTHLTPEALTKCTKAIDLASCDAYVRIYYENVFPDACEPLLVGALPDGAPCGAANQCIGARCFGQGPCGVCATAFLEGASCGNDVLCGPGMACRGVCVRFRDAEQACDPQTPCHPYLVCAKGICTRGSDPCDPGVGCSAVPALQRCNATTQKCEPIALGHLGASCTDVEPIAACDHGLTCGRSGAEYGCVPLTDFGGSCDRTAHPFGVGGSEHAWEPNCARGTCGRGRCGAYGVTECTAPPEPP
jgi:hypothetical protein